MWKTIKRWWRYLAAKLGMKLEESADPKVQLEQAIQEARQLLRRHRCPERIAAAPLGDRLEQRAADMGLNVDEEPIEVATVFVGFVNQLDDFLVVAGRERRGQCGNLLAGNQAVDVEHVGLAHFIAAEGNHLVEDRLRVAHAAVGHAGDAL